MPAQRQCDDDHNDENRAVQEQGHPSASSGNNDD